MQQPQDSRGKQHHRDAANLALAQTKALCSRAAAALIICTGARYRRSQLAHALRRLGRRANQKTSLTQQPPPNAHRRRRAKQHSRKDSNKTDPQRRAKAGGQLSARNQVKRAKPRQLPRNPNSSRPNRNSVPTPPKPSKQTSPNRLTLALLAKYRKM